MFSFIFVHDMTKLFEKLAYVLSSLTRFSVVSVQRLILPSSTRLRICLIKKYQDTEECIEVARIRPRHPVLGRRNLLVDKPRASLIVVVK